MKTKFVDQGIPVILGELGLVYRVLKENQLLEDYNNYNKIVTNMDMLQKKYEDSEGYFLEYVAE